MNEAVESTSVADTAANMFELGVAEETLFEIYEKLLMDEHRGSAADFQMGSWALLHRAARGRLPDWRLDTSKYMDAEDIYEFATEEKEGLEEQGQIEELSEDDQEMVLLHSEIIGYYESDEPDELVADDYRHWLHVIFPDKVFLTTEDRRQVDIADRWLRNFVSAGQAEGDADGNNTEALVRWITVIWSVIHHVLPEALFGNYDFESETLLDGVSTINFLRAMDLTQDVNSTPILPDTDVHPLRLLEAGYDAYDYDAETGEARILWADDYEKLGEDGASLPDEWKLKILRSGSSDDDE